MGCSDCDGVTELRIKSTYDNQGKVSKKTTYTLAGELISWTEYQYDDKGQMIEEREYDGNSLSYRDVHSYDQNGNKIATSRYDSYGSGDKPTRRWEYRYDSKRQLIEMVAYHSDGTVFGKTSYRYDGGSNVTEEAHLDDDGDLSSKSIYDYKYDSQGNWIERMTYAIEVMPTHAIEQAKSLGKEIKEILYRTITYY